MNEVLYQKYFSSKFFQQSFCLKVAIWHGYFHFLKNRLKLKAIKFIVKNYKEVSATPGWNTILDQHPRALAAILEYQMNRVEPLKWQTSKPVSVWTCLKNCLCWSGFFCWGGGEGQCCKILANFILIRKQYQIALMPVCESFHFFE